MLSPATNQIIDRYCGELLTDGDFDNADEILAPDFVIHGVQTLRSRERFLDVQSTVIRKAFPDLRIDVKDVFGDDEKVAVRSVIRGTHQGEYLGIEPTGTKIDTEAVMLCRLSDGRLTEVWPHMDSLSWFQQLGGIPLMEWQKGGSTASHEHERTV